MKTTLITTLILALASCNHTKEVERFELPPENNYTYYETSSPSLFIEMAIEKAKDNKMIHDPSVCLKDKSKLPQKKHILEDMTSIGADSVLVVSIENSNGRLENKDGSYKFGYKKGYHCKSAAFFKKK